MPDRWLLIGVGNPLRRDDGIGPAVINQLTLLDHNPDITLINHHGEGLSLLEAWRGYPSVILIDATHSGQKPGTIQRFVIDPDSPPLPCGLFRYSSHLFGVAEAVALAQSLNRLPTRLVVYGIEGLDFSHGEQLTPPAQAALPLVIAQIKFELSELANSR